MFVGPDSWPMGLSFWCKWWRSLVTVSLLMSIISVFNNFIFTYTSLFHGVRPLSRDSRLRRQLKNRLEFHVKKISTKKRPNFEAIFRLDGGNLRKKIIKRTQIKIIQRIFCRRDLIWRRLKSKMPAVSKKKMLVQIMSKPGIESQKQKNLQHNKDLLYSILGPKVMNIIYFSHNLTIFIPHFCENRKILKNSWNHKWY